MKTNGEVFKEQSGTPGTMELVKIQAVNIFYLVRKRDNFQIIKNQYRKNIVY